MPSPDLTDPGRFWPRLRWLLVGLVLCRGVALACVLPPFEGWDEYQHVAYVEHVRQTGRAAVLWETSVAPGLLAEVVKFPQPECAVRDQLGRLGGVGYAAFWARHDPRDPRTSPPAFLGGAHALYQAQHSPFSYRLAAPLYAALGGAGNLRWSVAGLRLANVGLTAAAVGVALGALRRVVRRDLDAALIGLALAAHPLFLLNGARVANDALGVFLATAAVAAGLKMLAGDGDRRPVRNALGVGLLVGLAVLAKATNFGLVPFGAFCWLATAARLFRAGRRRAAGLAGLAMAAGCLVVIQGELRSNLARYGGPTSMQEAAINRHNGATRADLIRTAGSFDWPGSVGRLWGHDLFFTGGWSFLMTHVRLVQAYREAVTLGLLGWAWWAAVRLARRLRGRAAGGGLVFNTGWVPASFAVLVLGYTAALSYHMVQSKLAWGVSTTNPWYACPALPWFLALSVAGGLFWPLGRRLRPALPLVLAGLGVAGEWFGAWARMLPVYSGGASGGEALARLAWLQPGWLGTPTLASSLAAEAAVLAALALTLRDAARAGRAPAGPGPFRGPHPAPAAPPHAWKRWVDRRLTLGAWRP